jgi:hypothetical protein
MTAEIAVVITAIATAVYGLATLLLWLENREDRKQRDKHFREEAETRRLNELRCAFYEAWGYWQGYIHRSGDIRTDASQAGRQFEALVRLECQLRLNGYKDQANSLGLALRRDLSGISKPLGEAGVALGLLPNEYRGTGGPL